LTESLVLAAAGGALGVAFAYGGMQLIIRFCGDLAARGDLEINGTVLLFLAAISLVTGLLFCTAPAAFAQARPRRCSGRKAWEEGRPDCATYS
jgi:ABC-type antimicrobial peptide transport system permease subunit